MRRGLREVIEAEPGLKVVAEVGDGQLALERIEALKPDVAVLDINMPSLDGISVARAIREKRLPVEIVFLTVHKEGEMLEEATSVGAKGYVLKDGAAADVVSAIKAVARGNHYISPAMSGHLVQARKREAAITEGQGSLKDLTASERRVLKLIAEYKTTKEIADELCVSPRTVEAHRAHIATKLGLRGSHALIKFVIQHSSEL